jgi:tetratricopeptide (TPR) repeat protein
MSSTCGEFGLEASQADALVAFHQAALGYLQCGRNTDARLACERVLAIASDHADTLHLMGLVSLQAERFDDAVEWISRAIRREPKPVYLQSLGTILLHQGRPEEARLIFEKAIQLKPDVAELWKNLGLTLIGLRRPIEAIVAFERAIRKDPKPAYLTMLGNALWAQGRREEAVAVFDKAVQLKPDDATLWCNMGNALLDAGRSSDALLCFEHVTKHRSMPRRGGL